LSNRIIDDPIKTSVIIVVVFAVLLLAIGIFWDFLTQNIFPDTVIGIYKKSFWENLVIGLYGVLIDLALVAILIFWLDHRRNRRVLNQQFKEDLEDYAQLDFDEINLKKLGHLKRLNSNEVYNVDVQNLILNRMHVKNLKFSECKLIGLKVANGKIEKSGFTNVNMRSCNFKNSILKSVLFSDCILLRTKFINAELKGVNFYSCNLERSNFSGANLQSVILKLCNIRGAKFENTNLKRANFLGAKNVDVSELAKANNLDYIQLDSEIFSELKTLRPDMNYQGKNRP